jgi:hypothetical protein
MNPFEKTFKAVFGVTPKDVGTLPEKERIIAEKIQGELLEKQRQIIEELQRQAQALPPGGVAINPSEQLRKAMSGSFQISNAEIQASRNYQGAFKNAIEQERQNALQEYREAQRQQQQQREQQLGAYPDWGRPRQSVDPIEREKAAYINAQIERQLQQVPAVLGPLPGFASQLFSLFRLYGINDKTAKRILTIISEEIFNERPETPNAALGRRRIELGDESSVNDEFASA